MILYEDDSASIESLVQASTLTAISLIAYAGVRSAFARRFREKAFSAREYKRISSGFDKDWQDYLQVQVTQEIVKKWPETSQDKCPA